jgi:hypothetical protein
MGLFSALCDDRITPEQFRELESLVCNDPEVARLYVSIIHLNSALYRFAFYFTQPMSEKPDICAMSGEIVRDNGQVCGMDETMVLPALPPHESEASDVFEEVYQPRSVSSDRRHSQTDDKRLPYLKGGFAALLVLGVGLLGVFVLSPKAKTPTAKNVPVAAVATAEPPPTPVATLDLAASPVWEAADMPQNNGNFIVGQSLSLKSGDVRLSLHHGGRLVVEGPTELKFISDTKISLHLGKIVATIPGGGLVVSCPNGSVTDLGTQFGLAVDSNGRTEVAVFQGRVSASLTSTTATQSTKALLLNGGQAAVMTDTAMSVSPEGAIPQRFVCNLINGNITSLDVTDLVSGGDGTTHRRGIGIDANTGEIGALAPTEAIVSDGQYHRVQGYPVIDGAFVPDGTRASIAVDSAGDQFNFLGAGNSAYNNIYTGGKIPWPIAAGMSTMLAGVDYASPEHGIICIHPNNALTLDLDAIRRIYPDRALTKFHCLVVNTSPVAPNATRLTTSASSAVYVLVNGVARFENPRFTNLDGSIAIDVPLLKDDRFLTLASTDARKKDVIDWILWADTKLDLSAGN